MVGAPYRPKEILFSITGRCNLSCPHCDAVGPGRDLSVKSAERFIDQSFALGIRRIGFTGGEPFLSQDSMFSIIRQAVKKGMLFGNIMTNAVWYKNSGELKSALLKLRDSGYDGSLCISADVFHDQSVPKICRFIKTAINVFRRPDVVSIAYASGVRDAGTKKKLQDIAKCLKAGLIGFGRGGCVIKNSALFIRLFKISLSSVGRARHLKDPWTDKWFKEDYCNGPGNIFFVEHNGDVKPCCGYATGSKRLTIGNINTDSVARIIAGANRNRFVNTVFSSGLSVIRDRLIKLGIEFPGKTDDHCFFCWYVLNKIPDAVLEKSINNYERS